MIKIRDSISKKLTALNMLVSGTALLVACIALFAYDLSSFRQTTLNDLSIQAQIIGFNSVTPLVFNDARSAQQALSALQASPHILYAGIYKPNAQFFAGYWRDQKVHEAPPPIPTGKDGNTRWFREREFTVVQPIVFDGKPVGTVYIRSDIRALVDRLKNYALILVAIAMLALLAALLISWMSQRAIAKPITALAEAARTVSRDRNYGVRAAPTADMDEVSVLIKSFNEMLAEIQKRDTALQESEEQFRTLADSVSQLAWMAHSDGYLFWYNKRWYEYTGTTPEQMSGWGWQSVHDPKLLPIVLERWRASITAGKAFEMVFPLRGKDGAFRDFLTLAVPVRGADGKVLRWFGTNTDITEQRRSEEALRRSEKLAATGRLAASIAHEINNPLEAVTNLIYLAQKNPSNTGKYLEMADQELERIAEITRHTLGFFRDTSTPVKVNISEVLLDVLNLYDRKIRFKKIAVKTRLPDGLEITCFPGEIRQVFSNLVSNAVEAMEEHGWLCIKASRAHDWTNGYRSGVRVSVLDTGCGIGRDEMPKIFEPFYTTKKDVGTGLGLWLTRGLVQKHHGSIRVKSRTGPSEAGTVFSVFLPREPLQGRGRSPEASIETGKRNIHATSQ